MGSRRRAREIALQVLCLLDMQPALSAEQALALYYQHLHGTDDGKDSDDSEAPGEAAEVSRFADNLVRGVRDSVGEIDQVVGQSSRNWRLERMNWVDRNLLRLAAYELRSCPDVPAKVAINEAIELAKRFGTAESSAFINGVLDRVMEEIGRR